ncbi:MAG: PAS domain-containing protein [Alphaproteobacteria bacterium]|nr:PAS domain-containing protein [Alphaproteobacteria bacterium]
MGVKGSQGYHANTLAPRAKPAGGPIRWLIRLPLLWALLTVLLAGAAAFLHLKGQETSVQALYVSGFALLAFAGLAWALGAAKARDSASRLLRAAADESGEGLLMTAGNGRFVYSNPSFHRLFRMAAENGSGRVKSLDAIAGALNGDATALAAFQRLAVTAEAGIAGHEEFPVAIGSGQVEWRRLTVSPVTRAGHKADGPGALWRAEDITAGREMDTIRREEETHLADFLDMLPVGFFSADASGHFLYVNQTLAQWLDSGPEDMAGQPLDQYMSPGEDKRAAGINAATVSFKRRDGGTFSGWVIQSLHAGDGERPAYSRCVVLRSADWRYRDAGAEGEGVGGDGGSSEIRLHWLFDEAPVGIVLLDLQGNIAECNRAFLKLIGLNPEDLIGLPFADRVAKEDRGDIAAALSKVVMGTARATHMEVRMPGARERELMASLYASRLENAEGELSGLALHFIDTTEQINLEVQFAQSQKMDAVGQLAGGVAHDFNNLLTAMIGFSDLLLARHGPGDPDFADIQQIRQNASRATNLVRQLLAFSRKQALALVQLDVTETLNELTTLLGRLIGEKIALKLEHGKDLGAIKVDRGQFDQVIINLAVNARDAMPGGGELTLTTSSLVLDAPVQRGHDLMPRGPYVLIRVSDTGTGIRKEDMERIFEPFFSTKEVGAGTGLGLSTVYGIVHQTGGFIFVDSAPGEGTTFSIYMPKYTEDDEAKDLAAGEAPPRVSSLDAAEGKGDLTGSGTVLLVEDEDAVRLFGARALRNKGYTVLEAENGESALDVLNSADGTIDLIISDVVMPGMDGNTLVGLVRHELPDVKVILMSGYAEDVFRDEIERDPTIHFLPKPFSLKGLAAAVKGVMEG